MFRDLLVDKKKKQGELIKLDGKIYRVLYCIKVPDGYKVTMNLIT